uniref:Interleukin 17 receptor A n=1 Tax=Sphenodon punctatus TaxID=8508 RepID=A0A8D0GVL5_SPHPU
MGRMTALLPRGGGLLLLLFLLRPLPFLLPGSAGLRLLLSDSSPFNCSQLGLKCVVKNSTCMDESWVHSSVLTPSAPSTVDVHLDIFQDKEGKLLPVLQIQWMVATDASIRSFRGVELTVLQVNDNRQICTWFDFQNNLMLQAPPGGGRWNFTFNRFEVQPGQMYHVTVYHLPKLGIQGDHNRKSKEYKVPDCEDKRMRRTTPCVQMGSLWEPSIDGKHLEDGSVLVSFNPGKEPARYQIHVTGFLDKKICMDTTQEVPKVTTLPIASLLKPDKVLPPHSRGVPTWGKPISTTEQLLILRTIHKVCR